MSRTYHRDSRGRFATQDSNNNGLMQRKDKNTGEFARFPLVMQMKTIKKIARKYKIALKDEDGKPIKIKIVRDKGAISAPFTGRADIKNRIDLLPRAFTSEEDMARTLYHEKLHLRQYKEHGQAYVQNNRQWFEDAADKAEVDWWETVKHL